MFNPNAPIGTSSSRQADETLIKLQYYYIFSLYICHVLLTLIVHGTECTTSFVLHELHVLYVLLALHALNVLHALNALPAHREYDELSYCAYCM